MTSSVKVRELENKRRALRLNDVDAPAFFYLCDGNVLGSRLMMLVKTENYRGVRKNHCVIMATMEPTVNTTNPTIKLVDVSITPTEKE